MRHGCFLSNLPEATTRIGMHADFADQVLRTLPPDCYCWRSKESRPVADRCGDVEEMSSRSDRWLPGAEIIDAMKVVFCQASKIPKPLDWRIEALPGVEFRPIRSTRRCHRPVAEQNARMCLRLQFASGGHPNVQVPELTPEVLEQNITQLFACDTPSRWKFSTARSSSR